MSEESTKSFGRQCNYCRRIHPLGNCGYGISKGIINEHKLAKLEGRKSKGNPPKAPLHALGAIVLRKENLKKGPFKKYALEHGMVKKRIGKLRSWNYL